jgi:hypothetical protein
MAAAKLSFNVSHDALDPSDERWETQVQGLLADLKEQVSPVERREEAVEGMKSGSQLVAFVVALGTSGAISAAVAVFRAWLARDKNRTVEFEVTDADGKTTKTVVKGTNISEDVLKQALAASQQ